MNDTLSTIWQPSSGRFDDGVEEKQAPSGLPPSKRGPRFEELMQMHGITEDDLMMTCPSCGKKHHRQKKICSDCEWKSRKGIVCASNAPSGSLTS